MSNINCQVDIHLAVYIAQKCLYTLWGDRAISFTIIGDSTIKLVSSSLGDGNDFNSINVYGIKFGDVYSTEETPIGKWIDGSTIYRKMFDITEQKRLKTWYTLESDTNVKRVIEARAHFLAVEASGIYYTPAYAAVIGTSLQFYVADFSMAAGTKIIIEYTKN